MEGAPFGKTRKVVAGTLAIRGRRRGPEPELPRARRTDDEPGPSCSSCSSRARSLVSHAGACCNLLHACTFVLIPSAGPADYQARHVLRPRTPGPEHAYRVSRARPGRLTLACLQARARPARLFSSLFSRHKGLSLPYSHSVL